MNGERTLHLFAGAGGGLLADRIVGHVPVCAVEWDRYCCQVLRERRDAGWFPGLHVHEGDVRLFPASDWAGRVDGIHAGFPCPPFSVAGKRQGALDERNMWPATARVIGEVRPRWVFLENVGGFVSSGYGWTVLSDLSRLGYDARWTCLGADQAGAPHRRERWWCLAYADSTGGGGIGGDAGNQGGRTGKGWGTGLQEKEGWHENTAIRDVGPTGQNVADAKGQQGGGSVERAVQAHIGTNGQDVADADRERQQERRGAKSIGAQQPCAERGGEDVADGHGTEGTGWWETEPDLGRMVDGLACRVDRLKALGNGQVPLQAALAIMLLRSPT